MSKKKIINSNYRRVLMDEVVDATLNQQVARLGPAGPEGPRLSRHCAAQLAATTTNSADKVTEPVFCCLQLIYHDGAKGRSLLIDYVNDWPRLVIKAAVIGCLEPQVSEPIVSVI